MSTVNFRRPNGEIVEINSEYAFEHAAGGKLTLDGEVLERVFEFIGRKAERAERAIEAPIDNFNLGVGECQLEEVRAEAQIHGLPVEYVEDKEVTALNPTGKKFYNARFKTTRDMERTAKFYDMRNRNGGVSGRTISADELRDAERQVIERYGPAKEKACLGQ